jgi:hypothetical protein
MEESAFLPLPEGMSIDHVHQSESQLTVVVISTSPLRPVRDVAVSQNMSIAAISERSKTFLMEAAVPCCASVCASSFV